MSRCSALAKRLEEVFLNGTWIANTNWKAQLDPTAFELATGSIGPHNTIAALTFHINYYLEGLIQVFEGGPLTISDKYSYDLPPLKDAEEWELMKERFFKNATVFAALVGSRGEDFLDAPFVQEKYGTNLKNIEAVLEHSYYHLGQVVLLRKLLLSRASQ